MRLQAIRVAERLNVLSWVERCSHVGPGITAATASLFLNFPSAPSMLP